MKKFFSLIAALVIVAACSTEDGNVSQKDSVIFNTKGTEPGDLKKLYDEMIASQFYTEFKTEADIFIERMNFDGEVSEIEGETKMLGWISANLHKTDFYDYNEAVSKWNGVKQLQETVIIKHPGFYEGAIGYTPVQLLPIITNPTTPEPTNDPCAFGCINQGVACGDAADSAFAISMGESVTEAATGDIFGATITAAQAYLDHSLAQSACARKLKSCMCKCNPALCK